MHSNDDMSADSPWQSDDEGDPYFSHSEREVPIAREELRRDWLEDPTPIQVAQWVVRYSVEGLGRTQREVAEVWNVHESFVSRVIRGKQCLSIGRILELAKHFEMPLPVFVAKAIEFASPETWEKHLQSPQGRLTQRVLARRDRLDREVHLLEEKLKKISHEALDLIKSPGSLNRSELAQLRHISRLCDEGISCPESLFELIEILWRSYLNRNEEPQDSVSSVALSGP